MRGIDYSDAFLFKVWMTMNPIKGLFLGVLAFLIINSYLLLLVERGDLNSEFSCYESES